MNLDGLSRRSSAVASSPSTPPRYDKVSHHRAPRHRLRLWLVLVIIGVLSWRGFGASRGRARPMVCDGIVVDPLRRHFRFTVIMVHGGADAPAYLPLMLRSAAANAHDFDLLFVNVQDPSGACLDLSDVTDSSRPTYAPNIRHLCLSPAENDSLISDFLCRGWGGCAASDRRTISDQMDRLRLALIGVDMHNTFKVRAKPLSECADLALALARARLPTLCQHRMVGVCRHRSCAAGQGLHRSADLGAQLFGRFSELLPYDIMDNFDGVFTTVFRLPITALYTPVRRRAHASRG